MRGRDKEDANDKREELFGAATWHCVVCGGPLNAHGTAQLGHRVIKSRHNLATYGTKIINHPLNLVPVCGLRCNSRVILNFQPAEQLLSRIFDIVAGVEPEPDMHEHYAALRDEFHERGGQ